MSIARRIVLHFPKKLANRPVISKLVKDYDLEFNILKAQITEDAEGLMVLEITGSRANYDEAIQYLTGAGFRIQALSQDVSRNEEKCTHCGYCITLCPSGAFKLDSKTHLVKFLHDKCVACGLCIKACPHHAMELHF